MANIYFEIADCAIPEFEKKYFVVDGGLHRAVSSRYMQHSERAWMEQEGKVWFIKHRYLNRDHAVVDMKEFMWVKLKAETVRG